MNLLLFGAPGTGKGTQALALVSHFQLHHISTGDLFRQASHTQSALGLKVTSYINKGRLVPDSLVIDLMRGRLKEFQKKKEDPGSADQIKKKEAGKGFVLDGFPRTLAQARALDLLLEELGQSLNHVFYLKVDEALLLERLTGRRVAQKSGRVYHIQFNPPEKAGYCDESGEKLIHRKDDRAETIKTRLQAYFRETAPLVGYYKNKGLLVSVDGRPEAKEVFLQIKKILLSSGL